MRVFVPKVDSEGNRVVIKPKKEESEIYSRMQAGEISDILSLQNKSPVWREGTP